MKKLQDKVAIITGAASGIGAGIATAMVKEGAKVVIVDINEELGKQTGMELKKYSPESFYLNFDLMQHQKLHKIVEMTVEKFGKLDILVNNAHASKQIMFEQTEQEHFDFSFGTGFYPTFYLMKAAMPYLKETKGNIINFASGAGLLGQPTQTSYVAAKEAIRGISRVAANEYAQFGITINIISPIANSEGVQKWAKDFPEMYNSVLQTIPIGRFGDPENDIGKVAVFLASEDSKFITGQTIMADGGSIMLR